MRALPKKTQEKNAQERPAHAENVKGAFLNF
jgi:hypothetical protein